MIADYSLKGAGLLVSMAAVVAPLACKIM